MIKRDKIDALLVIPLKLNDKYEYTDGEVVLSYDGLYVFTNKKVGLSCSKFIRRDEMESFKVIHFVGAGMLVHETGNSQDTICYFSKESYGAFRYLEKVLNGTNYHLHAEQRLVPTPKVCDQCGHVIPEKAGYCPVCIKKTSVVKYIAQIAKHQVWLYALTVVVFFLFTAMKTVPPIFYRKLIDDYLTPRSGTGHDILMIILIIGVTQFLVQVFMSVRRLLMAKAASSLVNDLRNMVYEKIQSFSLSYIHRYKTGDLMNRITGDTQTRNILHCLKI